MGTIKICPMKNDEHIEVPEMCPKDCIYLSNNNQTCSVPFAFDPAKGGKPGGKYVPVRGMTQGIGDFKSPHLS